MNLWSLMNYKFFSWVHHFLIQGIVKRMLFTDEQDVDDIKETLDPLPLLSPLRLSLLKSRLVPSTLISPLLSPRLILDIESNPRLLRASLDFFFRIVGLLFFSLLATWRCIEISRRLQAPERFHTSVSSLCDGTSWMKLLDGSWFSMSDLRCSLSLALLGTRLAPRLCEWACSDMGSSSKDTVRIGAWRSCSFDSRRLGLRGQKSVCGVISPNAGGCVAKKLSDESAGRAIRRRASAWVDIACTTLSVGIGVVFELNCMVSDQAW